jgi:hypothetical protein
MASPNSDTSTRLAAADCRVIEALAEQSSVSTAVIEILYLEELHQLEPARIRQFLPVITGRRVRDLLREKRAKSASAPPANWNPNRETISPHPRT